MKIQLLLLILCGSIVAHTQSETCAVMQLSPGDVAYLHNNYKQAIVLYNRSINEGKADKVLEHNLAVSYGIAGNIDSAFYFLYRILNVYKDDVSSLLNDPDVYLLTKDKRWKEIEQVAIAQYFQNHSVANKELCLRLLRMYMYDQAYYYMIESIRKEKKVIINSDIKKLWSIKDSLNNSNVYQLEAIIKEYGYPTKAMVGEQVAKNVYFVVQHADIKTQQKYLPLIEKLAFNNEIDKSSYAMLKDRILVKEGKKQLYGTQIKREKDGSNIFFPIEDSINVGKRRKQMGMNESLTDYLRRYNERISPLNKE